MSSVRHATVKIPPPFISFLSVITADAAGCKTRRSLPLHWNEGMPHDLEYLPQAFLSPGRTARRFPLFCKEKSVAEKVATDLF